MAKNTCSIDGCEKFVTGHGWCSLHYTRWRRYGDPQARIAGEVREGCRICPGCRVDKPLADYGAPTGRCRACANAQKRALRPHIVIPLPAIFCIMCASKFIPATRTVYCCSSECTKARKRSMDAYYQKVDGNYQSKLRWQENNPEARVNTQGRRRARKKAAPSVKFTAAELKSRMAFFGNRCWMCRGPFECVDHVKPIAKGGPHILANLRPACTRCNSMKSAKWTGVAGLGALIT